VQRLKRWAKARFDNDLFIFFLRNSTTRAIFKYLLRKDA